MATGFADRYAAEFEEDKHPRDEDGQFTLKVSKIHGPKGEKFENLGGKQQDLFAFRGEKGQMNLFSDAGVPDELLPKHIRKGKPDTYAKDEDPPDSGPQWMTLGGGARALVAEDGTILQGCEGVKGYDLDELDETRDERAAKQEQAEDAGWTSAKSDRARETWEAFKNSDPTHPHFIGLVRHGGKFHAFDESAGKLQEQLGIGDGQTAEFDEDKLPHHMERLIENGHRVAVIDRAEDGTPDLDSDADPEAQQAVAEAHEDVAEQQETKPAAAGFGIEPVHPERLKLTQDGREIGYMNLRVMGDRGYIDDTSIHAAARGQGVMRQLWPQIEQHFRDQGATSIRADVVDPAVGEKVWGPLGFQKEGMSGPVEVYRKHLDSPAAEVGADREQPTESDQQEQTPADTAGEADDWNAATQSPAEATDDQLARAIEFASHLHGHHQRNAQSGQITPEQLTSLHDMIDGHVATMQAELERRKHAQDQPADRGNAAASPGGTDDASATGAETRPTSGTAAADPGPTGSLGTRHHDAGQRIAQAPGPVRSLLESLHRLRDTRKTGQVETKELGHEYAREMYDHLKSLRHAGDDFGEVHDLSQELGHGAIGYASPAGNVAMVPPKFKGQDWQVRYTLPHESQQAPAATPADAPSEPAGQGDELELLDDVMEGDAYEGDLPASDAGGGFPWEDAGQDEPPTAPSQQPAYSDAWRDLHAQHQDLVYRTIPHREQQYRQAVSQAQRDQQRFAAKAAEYQSQADQLESVTPRDPAHAVRMKSDRPYAEARRRIDKLRKMSADLDRKADEAKLHPRIEFARQQLAASQSAAEQLAQQKAEAGGALAPEVDPDTGKSISRRAYLAKQRAAGRAVQQGKGVSPRTPLGRAIIAAVGDDPVEQQHFGEVLKEIHANDIDAVRNRNDAIKETLANFGFMGRDAGKFLQAIRKYEDADQFLRKSPLGNKFDQMTEYALTHFGGEVLDVAHTRAHDDPESAFFETLQRGMKRVPEPHDDEVVSKALEYYLSSLESSRAHQERLKTDPAYREEMAAIERGDYTFSRHSAKIRYARWARQRLSRWYRYARQLSLFDRNWTDEDEQKHPRDDHGRWSSKSGQKHPATGLTAEEMAHIASRHGHDYHDALAKITSRPSSWIHAIQDMQRREATQSAADKAEAIEQDWKQNGVRSKAFKSWFGDWERDPVNASKVVDKDGKPAQQEPISGMGSQVVDNQGLPVAMYHGTSSGEFEAFEKRWGVATAGENTDNLLYGPGFYFTDNQRIAGEYSNIAPVVFTGDVERFKRESLETAEHMDYAGYNKADALRVAQAAKRAQSYTADQIANATKIGGDVAQDVSLLKTWLPTRTVEALWKSNPNPHVFKVYLNIRRPFDADKGVPESVLSQLTPEQRHKVEKPVREAKQAIAQAQKYITDGRNMLRQMKDAYDRSNDEKVRAELRSSKEAYEYQITVKHQEIERLQSHADRGVPYSLVADELGGKAKLNEILKDHGYDGITHIGGRIMGKVEHRVWIAFEPNQIKSADNKGTFNPSDNRMRYSESAEQYCKQRFGREWYRYARQLSLFDALGGLQPATKPKPKGQQKSLFDEDDHPRATEHVEIKGKSYEGGQWIPKDEAAQASPAAAEKIEVVDQDTGQAKPLDEVEEQPSAGKVEVEPAEAEDGMKVYRGTRDGSRSEGWTWWSPDEGYARGYGDGEVSERQIDDSRLLDLRPLMEANEYISGAQLEDILPGLSHVFSMDADDEVERLRLWDLLGDDPASLGELLAKHGYEGMRWYEDEGQEAILVAPEQPPPKPASADPEPFEFKTAAQAAQEGMSFASWQQPITDAYRHERIDEDHPAWQAVLNAPKVSDYNDAMHVFGKHVLAHAGQQEVFGTVTALSDDLQSGTITMPDGREAKHFISNMNDLGPFLQDRLKRYIATKGLDETREALARSEAAKYLAGVMAQEAFQKQTNIGEVIKAHGFGLKEGMAIRSMVADEFMKLQEASKPQASDARKRAQEKRRQTDEAAEKKPDDTASSAGNYEGILQESAPYEEYGDNYNRNIAASANRLRDAMERGHDAKMLDHLASELRTRIDVHGKKPQGGGEAERGDKPDAAGAAAEVQEPEKPAAEAVASDQESLPSKPTAVAKHAIDIPTESIFAQGRKRSVFGQPGISVKSMDGANAIWRHQGDPQQVLFNAAQKGASEWDLKKAAEIKAAHEAGYQLKNYRAGKYGTLWVYEKDGRTLTQRGAEALVAGTGSVDAGEQQGRETAKPLIDKLQAYIGELPESTTSNFGALVASINRSPLGKHLTLTRDQNGSLRLSDKQGTWHIYEPVHGHDEQGEFHRHLDSSLPRFLAKLRHMSNTNIPEVEHGWVDHDRQSDAAALKEVPPPSAEQPAADGQELSAAGKTFDEWKSGQQVEAEPPAATEAQPQLAAPTSESVPSGWHHEPIAFDDGGRVDKYTSPDGKYQIFSTGDGNYEVQSKMGFGVSSHGTYQSLQEAVNSTQPIEQPTTNETFDPEQHGGYKPLLALADDIDAGKHSAESYKQQYAFWRQHADAFQADLVSRYNAQQLKNIASHMGDPYNAKSNSKQQNAKSIYKNLLINAFHTGDRMFSYGMDGPLAALDRHVQSQSDESLAQHGRSREEQAQKRTAEDQARAAAEEKAIADPQTLDDFKIAIRHHGGYEKLPEHLQAAYDDLYATQRRQGDKTRQSTVQGFRPGTEATGEVSIVEGHHQKRNAPTFTVTIEKHLGDNWGEALSRAKQLGGSYVNARIAKAYGATPGFQFFDRNSAEKFAQTLRGESADRSDIMDERRAGQIENASERMATLAQLQRQRAEEKLNAPRLTNTARRADMASSAEANARSEIAKANTMARISEGLASGTIKHLAGIRARTHVDALDAALRSARYKQYQEQTKGGQYQNYEDFMAAPASNADVAQVQYPYPTIWASELSQHAQEFADTPGLKKLAATLKKTADRSPFAKKIAGFATDGGLAKTAEELKDVPGARLYLKDQAVRIHASRDPKLLRGRHAIAYTADKGKTWGITPEIAVTSAMVKHADALDLIPPPKDELLRISDEQTIGQLETAVGKLKRSTDPRLRRIAESLHGRVEDYKRMQSMDIRNTQELRAALREYLPLRAKQEAEDPVKSKERALIGRNIPGFFPTPRPLVTAMLDAANIQPGMSVLEPSAGKGDILDAIRERHPDVQTTGVEVQPALRDIIQTKGHALADEHDFLDHAGLYDRIVMNPPFENRQDVQHVQHAYERLKPGGRLVAVMSAGPFHGSSQKDQQFQAWLDALGAEVVDNPEGSFTGADAFRQTGVNTKMVIIDK